MDDLLMQDEDTLHGQYLTFELNKQAFGIEIRYVTEILGMQQITPSPDNARFVKGVISLRGNVITVVDLRLLFGFNDIEYNERTCIIVIEKESSTLGLIVDTVTEVLHIDDDDLEPAPTYGKKVESNFAKNMGKVGEDIKILLDAERISISTRTWLTNESLSPDKLSIHT